MISFCTQNHMFTGGVLMHAADIILIVDDAEINRTILSEIFKGEYSLLEAADGEAA